MVPGRPPPAHRICTVLNGFEEPKPIVAGGAGRDLPDRRTRSVAPIDPGQHENQHGGDDHVDRVALADVQLELVPGT